MPDAHEKEDFNKLELALEDIFIKYFARNINKDNKNYKEQNNIYKKILKMSSYPEEIPIKAINPRDAFYSEKKTIKIEDSIGKISGEYIIPYPPGISLISPGEIITTEIITYIQEGVKNGMIVSGIKDANLEYIDIIDIG